MLGEGSNTTHDNDAIIHDHKLAVDVQQLANIGVPLFFLAACPLL